MRNYTEIVARKAEVEKGVLTEEVKAPKVCDEQPPREADSMMVMMMA